MDYTRAPLPDTVCTIRQFLNIFADFKDSATPGPGMRSLRNLERLHAEFGLIGQTLSKLHADLLDVHNQRLAQMDANGVDFVCTLLYHVCNHLTKSYRWFYPADPPAFKEFPIQRLLQT
jgi:hypothetical protein